jgi:ribonucleoside-diphosphate reductase alpha chain
MEIKNEILYNIWKDRYCKNNETINDNLHRVAKYVSKNAKEESNFYDVMNEGLFFPAGRTMSNSGIGKDLTLNNCFVAPQIQDDLSDIFDKVKLGACTHQKGGGIGYDFSQLRPKGSPTSNDAIASGAVSFMDVFNAQTATILQGNRRGANMGILSIYNMDIEDFINAKSYDEGKLVHFNVSVMVDNDFMKAVEEDKMIIQHYPVYDNEGKILKDRLKWKYRKEVSARYLWNLIMQKAYDNGEPGIFFYENLNNDNNISYIENIICTNPCAEYLAGTVYGNNPITKEKLDRTQYGGACNLGSVLLQNTIDNPFTSNAKVNYDKLKKAIHTGVRLLDNIIDINNFPSPIYKNYQEAFRTIGLGITGLGDMLCMLNLEYGSTQAIQFTDNLMNYFAKEAFKSSIKLAKEKGSFPFLNKEKFIKGGFIQKHIKKDNEWKNISDDILKYGIRNAKILSVAPTGTMSLTFGQNCSSGLEPIFSLSYDRKVKMGGQSDDNIKIVKMEDYAYKLWNETKENNIVNKDIFVTAMSLPVQAHLDMLKAIAFHIDMSCSKTINVPTEYPFADTKKVYEFCWKNGIKGCTIFRPNPIRQGILITEDAKKEKNEDKKYEVISSDDLPRGFIEEVPTELNYRKYKLSTGCGKLYVFVGVDEIEGRIYDIFCNTDGESGCVVNTQAVSRLISEAIRGGLSIEYTIKQLNKAGTCPSFQYKRGKGEQLSNGKSCASAIGNILKDILKEFKEDSIIENKRIKNDKDNNTKGISNKEKEYIKTNGEIAFAKHYNKCPICGQELRQEGGCLQCADCGWSKCD